VPDIRVVRGRYIRAGASAFVSVECLLGRLGRIFRLIVDTGISHTTLAPNIIGELRLPFASEPLDGGGLGGPGAGSVYGRLYVLESVMVFAEDGGIIQTRNLRVLSGGGLNHLGIDGWLGMNWLLRFSRVTLLFEETAPKLEVDLER
jgi:hypothetical protein